MYNFCKCSCWNIEISILLLILLIFWDLLWFLKMISVDMKNYWCTIQIEWHIWLSAAIKSYYSFLNKLYSIIIHRIPAIGYIKLAIDDDKLNSFKIGLIRAFMCIISLLKISTGRKMYVIILSHLFRPVNMFYHFIPYYTQNFLLVSS